MKTPTLHAASVATLMALAGCATESDSVSDDVVVPLGGIAESPVASPTPPRRTRCGPVRSASLAAIWSTHQVVDPGEPDRSLLDFLPVFVADGVKPGSSPLRTAPRLSSVGDAALVEPPLLASDDPAATSAAIGAMLAGLEIDAFTMGQDILRVKWEDGPAAGEPSYWRLRHFDGADKNKSDERLTPWAFIAFKDQAGSPQTMNVLYWSEDEPPDELRSIASRTELIREPDSADLWHFFLDPIDGLEDVAGLDLTNHHINLSFPHDGTGGDSPETRDRLVPDPKRWESLVGPLHVESGGPSTYLRLYFSVTDRTSNYSLIRKRLERGTPPRGVRASWQSGATIFSVSARVTESGTRVSPIRIEFVPGERAEPWFGFTRDDDIDALAIDSHQGYVIASLAQSGDGHGTDADPVRGSSFYVWEMREPGSTHGAEGCDPKQLPSPLHHWSDERLDAALDSAKAVFAAWTQTEGEDDPPADEGEDPPPRPIRPGTVCGSDPSHGNAN